jgi:hypothetical protein
MIYSSLIEHEAAGMSLECLEPLIYRFRTIEISAILSAAPQHSSCKFVRTWSKFKSVFAKQSSKPIEMPTLLGAVADALQHDAVKRHLLPAYGLAVRERVRLCTDLR